MRILLLLLLGCSSVKATLDTDVALDPVKDDTGDVFPFEEPEEPDWAIALSGTAVFDLVTSEAPSWVVDATLEADAAALEVLDAGGALVTTLADGTAPVGSVTWDGTDAEGAPVAPGLYTLSASLLEAGEEKATATASVYAVRVGFTDGALSADVGERVALCWHDGGSYWDAGDDGPSFVLSALDGEDGQPMAVPSPWDDLDAPPSMTDNQPIDENLPVAFTWESVPMLSLTVGGDLAGAPIDVSI